MMIEHKCFHIIDQFKRREEKINNGAGFIYWPSRQKLCSTGAVHHYKRLENIVGCTVDVRRKVCDIFIKELHTSY